MLRRLSSLALALAVLVVWNAKGEDENPLTRDEVSVIKKKLLAAFDALGQPPEGFTVASEHFNLPTEAYKNKSNGMYYLLSPSADRNYETGKQAEKTGKDLEKEYQKKMLDAQAKGDYQGMAKLAQEMQQKMATAQSNAIGGHKEPIAVSVRFNSNPGATIDPDAVVFERSGVIALKNVSDPSSEKIRIAIYVDPVALKETKQLSRVDLKQPEGGVSKRTVMLSATIELSGPAADVEAWAKRVDTKKVLAQIDAK